MDEILLQRIMLRHLDAEEYKALAAEYGVSYGALRKRVEFAEQLETVSPPKPAKPAPADHCEGCRWGNNGTEVCCLPQCLREVCR